MHVTTRTHSRVQMLTAVGLSYWTQLVLSESGRPSTRHGSPAAGESAGGHPSGHNRHDRVLIRRKKLVDMKEWLLFIFVWDEEVRFYLQLMDCEINFFLTMFFFVFFCCFDDFIIVEIRFKRNQRSFDSILLTRFNPQQSEKRLQEWSISSSDWLVFMWVWRQTTQDMSSVLFLGIWGF